jgi:flagellar motor switch protein FliM
MPEPTDEEQQIDADRAESTAEPEGAPAPDAAEASARILNQNEIDSLLGFSDGEAQDRAHSGMRAIIDSALVSYERLPMFEVDSALIYSIVDVLLGGRRGTAAMRIEGRPYTTIERNLVERMINVVLGDLSVAFDPLSEVTFRFERLETNPRFATIARPANAAVLARLRVDMEDRGGRLEVLLPYATLEPVRELLLQMFLGEKFGRDSIWEAHLAGQLWNTTVPLEAVLDTVELSLRDVLEWNVGSRIMLGATPKSEVLLRCGDVPMFRGAMGRKGGNIAIRILEKLDKMKVMP